MEFVFTDEQRMIQDTAEQFLADSSTSEAVRAAMETEQGFDQELWQRICTEMYWQAIHIPEEYGGLGLGYVELVTVLEQMGRKLLCSPFFSTVCLATNALLIAGTGQQKAAYLPQIAAGELTATLGWSSANTDSSVDSTSVIAVQDGDQFVLNGQCRYVIDGHTAQLLIISARKEGSQGEEGISLFLLSPDQDGVSLQWLPTIDQTRKQAEISLDNVTLPATALMGAGFGQSGTQLKAILALAAIALSAEQVGGSQQVLDQTVDYTLERQQFNRPIASFQAVKHKAADMMLTTEVSRSALYYAACIADQYLQTHEEAELHEAASVAKSYASRAYFKNAGEAIQLHGGVGFTWEYDVHLYFKRAKASEHLLGNSAFHNEQIAQLLLD